MSDMTIGIMGVAGRMGRELVRGRGGCQPEQGGPDAEERARRHVEGGDRNREDADDGHD